MTSDDGAKMHGTLTKATDRMARAAWEVSTNLEAVLRDDRGKLVQEVASGPVEAVDAALTGIRKQCDKKRLKLA